MVPLKLLLLLGDLRDFICLLGYFLLLKCPVIAFTESVAPVRLEPDLSMVFRSLKSITRDRRRPLYDYTLLVVRTLRLR